MYWTVPSIAPPECDRRPIMLTPLLPLETQQ